MFAANLTLGLYVHFGPKPLTPNSTVGLESVPLGGTGQPLATPSSYLTLVPLVATMLFIMGRFAGTPRGQGLVEADGQPEGGWLVLSCEGPTRAWAPLARGGQGDGEGSRQLSGGRRGPSSRCRQATPWAGGPSLGSSCQRSCPCKPAGWPRGSAFSSAGSRPLPSPSPSCWWW